jgi:Clathrin light chain
LPVAYGNSVNFPIPKMIAKDNTRQLPTAFEQSDKPTSSPNSPKSSNDRSEFVPIFYENDYLRAHDRGNLSQFTAAYDPYTSENPPTEPFPFQFPLPQIGRITMADRFPKIEDLDLGEYNPETSKMCRSNLALGDEPSRTASGEGSFLDRERAALGEDADQFATSQDRPTISATVQDGEDDLLGGDDDFGEPQHAAATTQEDLDFESSFPAIDTRNEVRPI